MKVEATECSTCKSPSVSCSHTVTAECQRPCRAWTAVWLFSVSVFAICATNDRQEEELVAAIERKYSFGRVDMKNPIGDFRTQVILSTP